MEKVWDTILDEGEKTGSTKRMDTDVRSLMATDGFPLAFSIPNRVGLLRAAGNSIVPQLAAAFIETVMEAMWKN
jgi:site-specific DNA-cytosine methylase